MTVDYLVSNRTSISSPPSPREHHGNGGTRSVIARGYLECLETLSSKYDLADVIMNTQQAPMAACTRPAWTRRHQSKRKKVRKKKGVVGSEREIENNGSEHIHQIYK